MRIEGKTFITTGGASGLGRAAAEAIVAAGGHAILVDVNAEVGGATEAALGARAKFVKTDVSSETEVQAAVQMAVSHFGGLHGVVERGRHLPAAKVLGKNGPHALDLSSRRRCA
jgi:NAD(P)-dependent dehydrogenase (short-subunit alcohol dehydrogenase family)